MLLSTSKCTLVLREDPDIFWNYGVFIWLNWASDISVSRTLIFKNDQTIDSESSGFYLLDVQVRKQVIKGSLSSASRVLIVLHHYTHKMYPREGDR